MIERGLAGADEVKAGHALRPGKTLKRKLNAADVPNTLSRGSYGRPAPAPARFKLGDRVRTKNIHPPTHTRLPRYARDRTGVVEALRGCHVYPDSVAIGQGENPQWLYTVLFDGRELWGDDTDPTLEDFDRSVRALSGAGMNHSAALAAVISSTFRATTTARCSTRRGRRKPLRWRCRSTSAACSPGANGRKSSATRSRRRRPPAIPTPARLIIITGWRRSSACLPKKA